LRPLGGEGVFLLEVDDRQEQAEGVDDRLEGTRIRADGGRRVMEAERERPDYPQQRQADRGPAGAGNRIRLSSPAGNPMRVLRAEASGVGRCFASRITRACSPSPSRWYMLPSCSQAPGT
jgi:hypothetical protein